MGCFPHSGSSPHLPVHLGGVTHPQEQRQCSMRCLRYGFRFFGLTNSGTAECFCGDGFGGTPRANAVCDKVCEAKPCGGDAGMSVYDSMAGLRGLGCYKMETGKGLTIFIGPGHTPTSCAHYCAAAGYLYAGITGYETCMCGGASGGSGSSGSSLPEYATAVKSSCSTPCNREFHRNCGGIGEYSVYAALREWVGETEGEREGEREGETEREIDR
eukprot:GHVU01052724.1.p1 GENE.GHVU01052724.1~~GHVU01052724.1.p1  ORF type:complete len:215 (+),score=46.16 GHVU01052724.1:216-860(+)